MRNHNKTFLLLAGCFLILIPALTAGAQNPNPKPRLQNQMAQQRALFGLQPYLGRLGLTQDQKDQIQAILAKYKSDIQSLTRVNVQAHQALNRIIAAGASRAELESAFAQAKSAEGDVVKLRATIALEIRQILTTDQLAKLRQILQAAGTGTQRNLPPPGKPAK